MNDTSDSLARIISLLIPAGASEEDVKIRIVMPFLRAFGYHDDEFGYEGRTGKGYVDIAIWTLPVGVVVEAKGPKKRLSDHLDQLESYVFQKHSRDRATVAILTNGDEFQLSASPRPCARVAPTVPTGALSTFGSRGPGTIGQAQRRPQQGSKPIRSSL